MYLQTFGQAGDRVDQLAIDRRRIEVEQTNPLQALDLVHLVQQLGQSAATMPAVASPHRSVLRDEDQFFGAAADQGARFGADRLGAAATERTAQRRNDAERARMIAAFGDFKVGRRPRRGDESRQKIVLGLGFEIEAHRTAAGLDVGEKLDDAGVGAGADDAVDLGNQALQLLAVALRQASGDDELLAAALARGVFENYLGRLGLGRIDERARINDDGIGTGGLGLQSPARLAQLGHHDFSIHKILSAA